MQSARCRLVSEAPDPGARGAGGLRGDRGGLLRERRGAGGGGEGEARNRRC